MYKTPYYRTTKLAINQSVQGEMLEQKIERIVNNKEPIKDGAPRIYTERKAGVQPQYDIRTDRFEVAIEATEKIAKSYKARREERHKSPEPDQSKTDPEGQSIQGKTSTTEPKN